MFLQQGGTAKSQVAGNYSAAGQVGGGPAAPDEPGSVDATITNDGTATIDWQPPDTDGGAAITGYRITVYNPDGTVDQTDAYNPGTTAASMTGLNGSATYTADITAVNGVGSSTPANVTVDQLPAGTIGDTGDVSGFDSTTDLSADPSSNALTSDSLTGNNYTYQSDGTVASSTIDPSVSVANNWNTSNRINNDGTCNSTILYSQKPAGTRLPGHWHRMLPGIRGDRKSSRPTSPGGGSLRPDPPVDGKALPRGHLLLSGRRQLHLV